MTWQAEALARGASVALSLSEESGAFDNAASATDATVSTALLARAEPPLGYDSLGSLRPGGGQIDIGIANPNLNDCSIDFMFKMNAGGNATLLSARGTYPGIIFGFGSDTVVGGTSNGQIYFGINGNSIWQALSTTASFKDGQVHHCAMTWDGTSGASWNVAQAKIYVDKVLISSTYTRSYNTATAPIGNDATWHFGGSDDYLANLGIYPGVVLAQADVDALCDANFTPSVAPVSPPVVHKRSLSHAVKATWSVIPYAQGYEYRIDSGTPVAVSGLEATATGLTNGQAYTLEVRATNSVGPGPWCTPIAFTPNPVTYESAIADATVVPAGYWPCQETSGTVLTEGGFAAGDGQLVGGAVPNGSVDPAPPPGVGKAIYLDGSNDHLVLPEGSTWFTPAANGFTISMWVYIRSLANWARLFDFANGASISDILLAPRNASSASQLQVNGTSTTGTTLPSGRWALVSTRVSESGARSVRVDKSAWYSGTGNAPVDQARANMFIGRSQYPADAYLSASVSRIVAWNADVLDEDLDALYDAGVEPTGPPSVAPTVTINPIGQGGVITWAALAEVSGTAPSYEYRIDGGTPVDVGNATRATIGGLVNGQSYAIEVRGLNASGAGPWSTAGTLIPTTVYLYDDFERANSATVVGDPVQGGPYTVRLANWGIDNGALYASSSTGEGHMTFPGAVDFDASITLKTPGANGGLLFRWIDVNNTWLLQYLTSNINLYRRTAGSWVSRVPATAPPAQAGDVLRLVVLGDKIRVYRNGSLILTSEDAYVAQAAPVLGFRHSSDTATRIGEIVVKPVSAFPDIAGGDVGDQALLVDAMNDNAFIYKGRDTKLADEGAVA